MRTLLLMKRWIVPALSAAFIAALAVTFSIPPSDPIDRTPPWSPFELNSRINLQGLVDAGYRFSDMPCGMVHFSKTVGDTTMRYYIEVDCKDYEIPSSTSQAWMDISDALAPPGQTSTEALEEEYMDRNDCEESRYYPFCDYTPGSCYESVSWSHFYFYMDGYDSVGVRDFITRNNSFLLPSYSRWDSTGATLLVTNRNSDLYFQCSVTPPDEAYPENGRWRFVCVNVIPMLDHKRIYLEEARQQKIRAYHAAQDPFNYPIVPRLKMFKCLERPSLTLAV